MKRRSFIKGLLAVPFAAKAVAAEHVSPKLVIDDTCLELRKSITATQYMKNRGYGRDFERLMTESMEKYRQEVLSGTRRPDSLIWERG